MTVSASFYNKKGFKKRALFERALCSLPDFWPFMPSSPPLLSIASALSESKWAITSPKKGQAMQRCHEEKNKVHVRKVHGCHPLTKAVFAKGGLSP